MRIIKTMQLTRVVLRTTSLKVPHVNLFFVSANSIAPTAPIEAASVGVAIPVIIEPSTERMRTIGGIKLLNTS